MMLPVGQRMIDGQVSGEATAGPKTLVVTAVRQSKDKLEPAADGQGMEPVTEQYLPDRYNVKSTLTAEIKPSGDNVLELVLESKP